jgi:hypothetical protein
MNPRDPLSSWHHRPAGEQTKGERHPWQRASTFFKDEADSKTNHPDPKSLNRIGFGFPDSRQIREKSFPAVGTFIEHPIVRRPIEANPRRID